MAGRKLITGRVAGSTIIEVIISMIIIIVVFGIAMMIYGNVTRSSLSAKRIKAEAILKAKLAIAEQNSINLNETVSDGDFEIEQEIKPYSDTSNHLIQVHLTAWDINHEKVAELQKIIIGP